MHIWELFSLYLPVCFFDKDPLCSEDCVKTAFRVPLQMLLLYVISKTLFFLFTPLESIILEGSAIVTGVMYCIQPSNNCNKSFNFPEKYIEKLTVFVNYKTILKAIILNNTFTKKHWWHFSLIKKNHNHNYLAKMLLQYHSFQKLYFFANYSALNKTRGKEVFQISLFVLQKETFGAFPYNLLSITKSGQSKKE